MIEPIIQVENISKQYHIGKRRGYRTFRDALTDMATAPIRRLRYFGRVSCSQEDTIWALEDVSFDVMPGEVMGIIGRNGAGKSTLLKILSRVTEPTKGQALLRGRVGSLLEVGTGFHPELTGRENIFLSGAILGMRRKEIKRRFSEIVEFSGVEKFIETPVKRYSCGMRVRLGFAVAAHLDPEIMLIDEVLAVGDTAFQKKCLGKMNDVAKSGRTILFVSHDMGAISRLCQRAVLVDDGRATVWDNVNEAVNHYLRPDGQEHFGAADLRHAPGQFQNRQVILTSISTHRLDGAPSCLFATGDDMLIRITYEMPEPTDSGYCSVHFLDAAGGRVMTINSRHAGNPLSLQGIGTIECVLCDVRLGSGDYLVEVTIGRTFPNHKIMDYVPAAMTIRMNLGNYLSGVELLSGQGCIAQQSQWHSLSEDTEHDNGCLASRSHKS